jgi:hypothetical protein
MKLMTLELDIDQRMRIVRRTEAGLGQMMLRRQVSVDYCIVDRLPMRKIATNVGSASVLPRSPEAEVAVSPEE